MATKKTKASTAKAPETKAPETKATEAKTETQQEKPVTGSDESSQTSPGETQTQTAAGADGTETGKAPEDKAVTGSDEDSQTAPGETLSEASSNVGASETDNASVDAAPVDQPEVVADTEVLVVRAKSGSFRRCGMRFTEEPTGIDLDLLTEEQVVALKAEPNLIVEEGILPDEAES